MSVRVLIVGAILGIAGCGTAQPTGEILETVDASGTLTLNGEPLEFYQVAFFPTDNRPAMGISDSTGKFSLGTNKPGDGAIVGPHKVAVTWVGPPSTDPNEGIMEFTSPPPPTVEIDPKYSNPETSGLVIEVPATGSSELNIRLE
jgi:hypothetical protein